MRLAFAALLLAAVASVAPAHDGDELGAPPLPLMSPAELAGATPDKARPQQPPGQALPLKAARHIRFETDRGTWMSLDLSPDGRRIVFDMLGDLYAMDAAGGRARPISTGMALETQPAFSPDGRWIAFVSDRSGADNLWIARPDGSQTRQISFGDDDTVLASPAWSADGKSLYVSRYRPDLNNYELWRHDLAGPAVGTLLIPIRDTPTAARDGWRSSLGAVAAPDGRSLYFARRTGGLDFDEVDEWNIVRRDLASGEEKIVVAEVNGPGKALNPGSFFRPALSPDGHLLAYAARLDGRTELRLRDLATGIDRRLAFPIERDQLQASMWQDIVPRYAFTPDGKAVILTRDGGFQRIAIADGAATPLPFTAPVDLAVGPSARTEVAEESGPVKARLIQFPVAAPDGRTLLFSALGRLYRMGLDGAAAPVAIDTGGAPAFQPSWSPDGRWISYVSWTERDAGAVWLAPADGSASPRRISALPAFYTYPAFTPDGQGIVTVRSSQAARLNLSLEYGKLREAELVLLPVAGGPARRLAEGMIGSRPQFTADGNTVYILAGDGLNAVDMASGARRVVALVKGPGWYFQDGAVPVDDVRISPDGQWLLAQVAEQLHLVAMPPADNVAVDLSDPHLPHRRLTDVGADFFEWGDGGRRIDWSVGSTFLQRRMSDVTLNPADRPGWTADDGTTVRHAVTVTLPRAIPAGTILLRGGRAFTMADGDRIIADADILVRDGRIAAIGPRGSFPVPAGTEIREIGGKTVLPGFIDTHDHIGSVRREVLGMEEWGLRARLAYGVTTSFDPSTLSIDMLAYQDMLDAGLMVGPRLRSTGPALFSMNRFASPGDVRAVLGRYRDDYRLGNIKEYRAGSRRSRQWIVDAARDMGLHQTTEGALSMKLDLSQIIDGYAGNEHALVAAPLQKDVLTLMVETRASYTATLQITNGGPPAQDQFIAAGDPHDDARLRHFWPHVAIDKAFLHRPWRRPAEYRFPAIAADAAALQRAGGLVGMGSHGEMPGIGFHWEMEAHGMGGMTPMEVLHAATIGSAETIGRRATLGSLEVGKFADMVILDGDPLADLRNARAVAQVMLAGRLYDATLLDQLWPVRQPLPPAWFSGDEARRWLPDQDAR